MRVKCLAQEHNTLSPARARTRTARSGVERTNNLSSIPSLSSKLFLSSLTSDPGNPDLSAQDTDASGAATSNIPLTDEDRVSLAYDPDEESEWLGEGREAMTQRLVTSLEALSQLHFAGPFVYPVDVHEYPDYWSVVPYPTDLNTVREKLLNKYYR